jgi:mannose-1-phosphate guanylyltransferase / mannose-6-phosphate isomerase
VICPVILCGGSGTRLWPLSRSQHPKQLISLFSDLSLLQETAKRVADNRQFTAPIIICNDEYRFIVAEQLRQIGINPRAIILEPEGRNTAPPATIAALMLEQAEDDSTMLIMPSDHLITDLAAFGQSLDHADQTARQEGSIVTLGIIPDQPHTGYGYIHAGDPLAGDEAVRSVLAFVEKPDAEKAQAYVDSGDYYWNSGMFLCLPRTLIQEVRNLAPEVLDASNQAFLSLHSDLDFVRIDAETFAQCPAISLDYAVMEKSTNLAVVPVSMGWSDIGSWENLWSLLPHDDDDNALTGNVLAHNTRNSLVRSDGPLVAVNGLEDVIVAATRDAVIVSSRKDAQNISQVVGRLVAEGRAESASAPRAYRPWGWFENIDLGSKFKVKRIAVTPGSKLSLQMHHQRAEHWIVVEGTARVTREDETFDLGPNQSTYIAIGQRHRLENATDSLLQMIEVQTGDYLEEDDIIRFDDDYGR